ncbi:cAMP-dependent protein kinase [Pelomyxa schiedti]|nr:cAMP-dependent protein kinase [Pelomyxa schiedti]
MQQLQGCAPSTRTASQQHQLVAPQSYRDATPPSSSSPPHEATTTATTSTETGGSDIRARDDHVLETVVSPCTSSNSSSLQGRLRDETDSFRSCAWGELGEDSDSDSDDDTYYNFTYRPQKQDTWFFHLNNTKTSTSTHTNNNGEGNPAGNSRRDNGVVGCGETITHQHQIQPPRHRSQLCVQHQVSETPRLKYACGGEVGPDYEEENGGDMSLISPGDYGRTNVYESQYCQQQASQVEAHFNSSNHTGQGVSPCQLDQIASRCSRLELSYNEWELPSSASSMQEQGVSESAQPVHQKVLWSEDTHSGVNEDIGWPQSPPTFPSVSQFYEPDDTFQPLSQSLSDLSRGIECTPLSASAPVSASSTICCMCSEYSYSSTTTSSSTRQCSKCGQQYYVDPLPQFNSWRRPPADEVANLQLRDLRIIKTIGTGTFGDVFLVYCQKIHSYFALKVMRKTDILDLHQVDHIQSERCILLQVDHPFIIKLYKTFQDQERVFMLMEYAIGGEVFSHLRRAERFPVEVARFYLSEIILALSYLHDLDIIYRDLKPENILLDGDGHTKLTDFGFAKKVTDRTWTLCGTPGISFIFEFFLRHASLCVPYFVEYLAPEVIQGEGHGKAVDWWSLGILAYEMLAGYAPFTDTSDYAIYNKIIRGQYTFPDHFDTPSRDLIRGLLDRDKSRRLGSARGASEDIKKHAFFHGVNWELVLRKALRPPIIPPFTWPGDTCNFDEYTERPSFDTEDSQQEYNNPEYPQDGRDNDNDFSSAPATTNRTQQQQTTKPTPQQDPYHGCFKDF